MRLLTRLVYSGIILLSCGLIAGFVVVNGARPSGAAQPMLGGKLDLGGFVVLKNGGTTMIRDITRLGAVGTR